MCISVLVVKCAMPSVVHHWDVADPGKDNK